MSRLLFYASRIRALIAVCFHKRYIVDDRSQRVRLHRGSLLQLVGSTKHSDGSRRDAIVHIGKSLDLWYFAAFLLMAGAGIGSGVGLVTQSMAGLSTAQGIALFLFSVLGAHLCAGGYIRAALGDTISTTLLEFGHCPACGYPIAQGSDPDQSLVKCPECSGSWRIRRGIIFSPIAPSPGGGDPGSPTRDRHDGPDAR